MTTLMAGLACLLTGWRFLHLKILVGCWLGDLMPDNVGEAIALLKPKGVDVATGVEFPNSTRKDPVLVKAFIQAAKNVKEKR